MVILACLIPDNLGKIASPFTNWPLHLTLVPWFELSGEELPKFLADLDSITASYAPFELRPNGNASFGPRKIKVTLIKPEPEIVNLHLDLLKAISNCHASLVSDLFTGSNFRPHVTVQAGKSLPDNKVTLCSKLYLVAKGSGSQRQIAHELQFGNKLT
jgi:2'-5' RNA ligase